MMDTKEKKKKAPKLNLINFKHWLSYRDVNNTYREAYATFLGKKLNRAKVRDIHVEVLAVVECDDPAALPHAKTLIGRNVYTWRERVSPASGSNHIETLFNALST